MADTGGVARHRNPYLGWVVSGVVLMLVFASAAVLWFMFHP